MAAAAARTPDRGVAGLAGLRNRIGWGEAMRLDDMSRPGNALPHQPVAAAAGVQEPDYAVAATALAPAISIIPVPSRERSCGTGQVP